ncbi:hypothetical protein D3C87_2043120 [compost metagenome]
MTTYHDVLKEQVQKVLKDKPDVDIYYNNESGQWLWSVQVCNDDFWLDSFDTCEEAVDFCQKHELKVITIKGE